MTGSPHYWNGSLSMAAALALQALKHNDKHEARRTLERTLGDFTRSAAATPELRDCLKEVRR